MYVHEKGRAIVTVHSRHTLWFVALAFGIPGKTVSFLLQPKRLKICPVHTRVHGKDVKLEEN